MLPDGSRIKSVWSIYNMFPVLDLYYADPAQPLTTAGEELDYLDHDLSVLDMEHFSVSVFVLFSSI